MKRISFCLLVAIAAVGCNKPEVQEDPTPVPARSTPAVTKAASATPTANDWMWKTSKGKPRDNDPLKVKDDPFDRTKK